MEIVVEAQARAATDYDETKVANQCVHRWNADDVHIDLFDGKLAALQTDLI